jgi:hypothetical protein
VCVSSVDRDAYRPGDVVLYARNGRLFVHRLAEMAGEAVVTRGDALLEPDPPVRAGDLLGRVVSIERGGWCGWRRTTSRAACPELSQKYGPPMNADNAD